MSVGRILYREDFLLHVRFAVREGGPDAFVQLRRFLKTLSRRECPGKCVTYRQLPAMAPPTAGAAAGVPGPDEAADGPGAGEDAAAGRVGGGEG